jgi:hypothetical protein
LFGWRREARREASQEQGGALCAGDRAPADAGLARTEQPRTERGFAPPNIELDIEGTSVWIWRGAETEMVTAIISALKGRK